MISEVYVLLRANRSTPLCTLPNHRARREMQEICNKAKRTSHEEEPLRRPSNPSATGFTKYTKCPQVILTLLQQARCAIDRSIYRVYRFPFDNSRLPSFHTFNDPLPTSPTPSLAPQHPYDSQTPLTAFQICACSFVRSFVAMVQKCGNPDSQ